MPAAFFHALEKGLRHKFSFAIPISQEINEIPSPLEQLSQISGANKEDSLCYHSAFSWSEDHL